MAKPVKIDAINEPFTTQKAAKQFFHDLKERYAAGDHLSGNDEAQVRVAYEQYCRVTDWALPAGITGFSVDNKTEEVSPGVFRTQKCLWYHLPDGTKVDFSIIKAIEKISRAQNP